MGFDVIVVGAGLWGSACARHLAEMGVKVALVGPSEPTDAATHRGVFGSHYDQARITRRMDSRMDWSRFSSASMARYADVEALGNRCFFHRAGSVIAGPAQGEGSDYTRATQLNGEKEGIDFEVLSGVELNAKFSFFGFPADIHALFEPDGGWIDPRAHVAAQIAAGQANGVTLLRTEVSQVDETSGGVTVTCRDGSKLESDKVIVAAGAFSRAEGLLPDVPEIAVFARTIALVEIDAEEQARLRDMPSTIYILPDGVRDIYVLPPVVYPNGKTYIKLGGDPDNKELNSLSEMKDWFRSGGNADVGAYLLEQLLAVMPGLRYQSLSHGACATSFTRSRHPLIYGQTDRIFALTGGNGAGAKCADEIGRLGALRVLGQALDGQGYGSSFLP
ncbi:MAG: FAD-binding oxidoreductase [Shimia sp.]|uniref:NAD(P)/FAD-dependent oxidoreductase n=1 Tax=Shimia sp. TaxID=1954381 RepID=UPI0025DE6B40|nr:FAD-dependent oxidoreductase [Shimia sp.]MCH2067455.1 FAD-binding oxidoreductase [Shimia sp.]